MNLGRWPINRYADHVTPRQSLVVTFGRMEPGAVPLVVDQVAPSLYRLPADIGAQLKRDFWKRHGSNPDWNKKYAAQTWIAGEVAEFEAEKIHRAFDEAEIRALAARWSDLCMRMTLLEVMQDFARSVGVDPPEVKRNVTRVGAAKRLSCPRWWRRQIRKAYLRKAEAHMRARGFVHRHRQVYASDRAVEHRKQRKSRDRSMLQEMIAVSDAGDQLGLWDVVTKSQANPALRRAELMTRLRGFEEVAQAAGHVAEFVTLTCPSAYHCTHANGTANERWEGFTPRQGQQWLSKMWARARAKLARLSVMFYGFRVAEPHHDGTPHWHLVMFVKETLAATLRAVLGGIWLREYADEPGARKHRAQFKRIDPAKGSACGYLAKYIAKNIDGHEVGDDYETEGQQASESCERVAAWASAHGIRQFQQVGGPPVTVWRELRRLRDVSGIPESIEAARQAADAGQWSEFIAALGGIECGRTGRRASIGLWRETTGELNQYDELRGPQIAGVEAYEKTSVPVESSVAAMGADIPSRLVAGEKHTALIRIRTREKVWRIQRKAATGREDNAGQVAGGRFLRAPAPLSSLGPVSITVRASRNMPGEGSTGAPRSGSTRGSPWMH